MRRFLKSHGNQFPRKSATSSSIFITPCVRLRAPMMPRQDRPLFHPEAAAVLVLHATNLGFGLSVLLSHSPLNPLHFPHQKELLVFVLTLQALHPLITPHPLIVHHDAQDLSDPIQMKSLLHRTRRQPGISVENRDPHLVPVWLESRDYNVDSACNVRQVARPLKHEGYFLTRFDR
ncbi:hypothetical protein BGW80DRAFT_1310536 [Lactifluus volemus]|nr:hypothetical protein BGW80DRAFT_1310536 [Lactifluus volemus]